MSDKKLTPKAKSNTAETYDDYFEQIKVTGTQRAHYRAKKALSLIEHNKEKVLSVGIGGLGEAHELKNAGFDVSLCDISPEAVRYASESGFNAFVCDITKENITSKFYYIFALEVLEHLVEPLQALENIKSALGPGGKLVISLPNEFHILARLKILFGQPVFGGHDWHHLRFFNRKLAEKMFAESNLKILKITYCPVIPLWNKFSICLGEILMKILPGLFSISIIWTLQNETEKNSNT